jgi:hypothetical protein
MITLKHARIIVSGPHLGPVRTTLWSWSPGCHHAAPRCRHRVVVVRPRRRRVWPQALAVLLLIGGISKAYEANALLGVLVTVLLAGIAGIAVYALIVSAGGPPRKPAASESASAEDKAAHPTGPRDWEQAA